jgi:hypothetical protein
MAQCRINIPGMMILRSETGGRNEGERSRRKPAPHRDLFFSMVQKRIAGGCGRQLRRPYSGLSAITFSISLASCLKWAARRS